MYERKMKYAVRTQNTFKVRFGNWLLKGHVCSIPRYNSGKLQMFSHLILLYWITTWLLSAKSVHDGSFEVILKNNLVRNKWVAGLLKKIVRVMATARPRYVMDVATGYIGTGNAV